MDLAFQTTIAYGGLGRYSIGLLSKLADYCDTITVYPTPLSAEVPTQHEWWREVPENVSVVKKHNFARSLLRDSTNFKKYDLVHINYASLGVPALLANSLFNTPYVYTVHHFDSPSRVTSDFGLRLKYEVERKLCFPLVSSRGALATVSEYNAKRMDGRADTVIPHGINPERVQTGSDFEIRDRFGLRENSDIVLFVGKFHSYKNTIDLIKAFSLVSSSSDAELVLLSSGGHEEQKIRSKISDLGLERDVSIIVDITDELLCYFYNEATVFAFPSQAEAFGLVYLEAMAAGLPVIHSGEGGGAEVVGDAGISVNPADHEEFATQILRVLGDPVLQNQLQAAGLSRIERFTWENAASQYAELYESIL